MFSYLKCKNNFPTNLKAYSAIHKAVNYYCAQDLYKLYVVSTYAFDIYWPTGIRIDAICVQILNNVH